ncbi:MAG: hypothetical protein JWL73_2853 [Actinomycetia bacterium]|nr:hypothetical protein [Actinomycetes bacterium]
MPAKKGSETAAAAKPDSKARIAAKPNGKVPKSNGRGRTPPAKVATRPTEKLAEGLAREIEREVIEQGWPVGTVLGSETELLDRFSVSRAVLREAIRLLEHHGVAGMRRGPGGGLILTEPNDQAVVRSVTLLLEYEHVTSAQLFEARMAIELNAVELASERITEPGIAALREALEVELEAADQLGPLPDPSLDRIHELIAEATGNPAMRLFVAVLGQLTSLHAMPSYRTGSARELRRQALGAHTAHEAIVEAVVAGDSALARHRMLRHLQAIAPWVAAGPGAPAPAARRGRRTTSD